LILLTGLHAKDFLPTYRDEPFDDPKPLLPSRVPVCSLPHPDNCPVSPISLISNGLQPEWKIKETAVDSPKSMKKTSNPKNLAKAVGK
jgi:hypothetical protein